MSSVAASVQTVKPSAHDDRWQAVQARDRASDGRFFYAVTTTGVYCRPSCSSRMPLRANVRFFDSSQDAEAAGFRPCKRCRPTEANLEVRRAELIARACRFIEQSIDEVDLTSVAAHVGMSPYHFHRLFKQHTGLTPRAYAQSRKRQNMQANLTSGRKVTEAVFDAGYNSSSRFYETSTQSLGMTPTTYRDGAPRVQIRFAVAETSLGTVLVAATERGVCAVQFGDPEQLVRDLQDRFHKAELIGGDAAFEKLVAAVLAHIEQPTRKLKLPLDIQGTAFQQRVWEELRKIPLGKTASYAEIAQRIGQPSATRAVAQACGANNIAVLIPCHRVVRSDASLSGYRWGIERKRALLDKESRRE